MGLDVHRALDSALFPERGVGSLVGQKELAALINEASGNHGQHVFNPGFGPGIKSPIQFEFFGQLEHGPTGAVFSGLKDLKGVGVALGQSLAGEGGLNEFELFEAQAGEAAMVGVHDFALVAERGAENADGVKAVGLDLKVDGAERFHDGYTIRYSITHVNTILSIVWLHKKHIIEAKQLREHNLAGFSECNLRQGLLIAN
jgi:hypothetical protein